MPIGVYDHWKRRGKKLSESTRRKISKALVGRKFSEEHKRNLSLAFKGRVLSEEHKRKIGLSNLGKKKGRKESLEIRKKLSEAHKRAWANGKYTKERNEKIRKTMQRLYRENKLKIGSMKMEKHPAWKGGISYIKKPIRRCLMCHKKYKDWRKAVFVRDDYVCQSCKKRGSDLEAHHIKSWDDYPDLRYCISNGITLCKSCHYKTFI